MKSFQPKEVIFRQGDPSDFAYLIEAGQVEVLEGYPDHPVHIALLGKGEIVGEMALVEERPRSLTARAVGEVTVSEVSREQFVKLMFKDPVEGLRYLRALFERLRAMNARVAHPDIPGGNAAGPPQTAARIRLLPLTKMSLRAVRQGGIAIEHFPFRVGREPSGGKARLSMNDLGLPDTEPFNVSREHFSIVREGDSVVLYDRGSFLGTIVDGHQIGGDRMAGSVRLHAGANEIIVGSTDSPFRFSLTIDQD